MALDSRHGSERGGVTIGPPKRHATRRRIGAKFIAQLPPIPNRETQRAITRVKDDIAATQNAIRRQMLSHDPIPGSLDHLGDLIKEQLRELATIWKATS